MSDSSLPIILITGLSGFIGRNLAHSFVRHGYEVRGLVRTLSTSSQLIPPGVTLFEGTLPQSIDRRMFDGVDVVIHCAYQTRYQSLSLAQRDNEESTKLVHQLSREANVRRFIFLSSLSAHPEAPSYYGRSKYVLECILDPTRDVSIRPGLVLGEGKSGLFGRIVNVLEKSPLVPVIDGGNQRIQTIYISDLCEAIRRVVEKDITGIISLADPVGITLKDLMRKILARLGRRTILITVPSKPLLSLLTMMEKMKFRLPISTENVIGLQHLYYTDTSPDLARLGMTLLPVEETLDRIFH